MTTLPTTSSIRLPRPGGPGGQVLAMPSTAMGPVAMQAQQPLLTPADIMRVLRGNLWLILASVLLAAAVGVVLFLWQRETNPRYQAAGTVLINRQTTTNPQTGEIRDQAEAFDLKVEQRTQSKLLMQTSLWSRVLEANPKVRETKWYKAFEADIKSRGNTSLTASSLALLDLFDSMRVGPEPESKLLNVSMLARDGDDAKVVLQAIVDAHIAEQQRTTYDRTSSELETAKGWKTRYERAMATLKDQMNGLQTGLNAGGAPLQLNRLNLREMEISSFMTSLMKARSEGGEAAAQLDSIMQMINAGNDPPQVEQAVRADPNVLYLSRMVDEYDMKLRSLSDQGPNSRYVKELTSLRDAAREKLESARAEARANARDLIVSSLKSTVQSRKAEEEGLSSQVDSRRAELGEISSKIAEYYSLKDEFDSYKVMMREIDERIAMLTTSLRSDSAGIRWYYPPVKADERSSPKLEVYLPVAIMIGLALSLSIAFLRELTNTSVRSPRDIAKVGSMNVLGMVADESDDPQLAGVPLHLVISQAPHSIMAEQFRQVRTRLQHAASLDTTRTIVITSPGPGDGKSTVACNLAAGLALNGRRILLVDANFRRPELHKLFSVPNEIGFANVLDSLANLESAVQKTNIPNLELLTTGPKAANPTELLESQLFSDFIDRSLEEYDHVIFDTGPLLVVSEAVALAPRVDGVITVVRAKVNSRGMLSRVRDTLRQIKAEHLGVVLNGVQNWGGGYYGRNIKTYYAYQNVD